jgi:hypothetical protein
MSKATIRFTYDDSDKKDVVFKLNKEQYNLFKQALEETGFEPEEFFDEASRWGKENNPGLKDRVFKRMSLSHTPGRKPVTAQRGKSVLLKRRILDYANQVVNE